MKVIRLFGKEVWASGEAPAEVAPAEVAPVVETPAIETPTPAPQAAGFLSGESGYYSNVFSMPFNGEKNLGEIGPIRQYTLDHAALRLRSWQLFLESEICQTVFQNYALWVIGYGLKLQAEPQKKVLVSEKVTEPDEDFNNTTEARFKVYANSTIADYSGMDNLHEIANTAFINSIVAGDVLVVMRFINGAVTVQIIDAAHLGTPLNFRLNGNDYITEGGNRVRHGIEINDRGQHVAYHVRKGGVGMDYDRIPARGAKTGVLMAFMVYGLKYRLDNVRGIPLITAVMETAKKMERYKEATIGSAEERQKIPFFIEHGVTSTGENPFIKNISKINGFGPGSDVPADEEGNLLANKVAASTNKTVVNLPNDSRINAIDSRNELHFKDFYTVNIDIVCATVGIPPNVAMGKYDSNFSASRAAIKGWEHKLLVTRKRFADQFYQNIYNFWLDTQILANKITAPGYLTVLAQQNAMALSAYRFARWVGANVPHIDPEKEVRAERLKLGGLGANLPLTNAEAATEAVNGGDSDNNITQFARELDEADELNITRSAAIPSQDGPPNDKEE